MLTQDLPITFDCGTTARIRIWQQLGQPPVVMATELAEANHGQSITNAAEYIAAEVLEKLLPQRKGETPPFVWVEHYGPRRRFLSGPQRETFDLVFFADYEPRQEMIGGRWLTTIGEPSWRVVQLDQVEVLLCEPLAA